MSSAKTISSQLSFKEETQLILLRRYGIALVVFWSVIIAAFLLRYTTLLNQGAIELAMMEAYTSIEKDLVYRNWITSHGGVYVPITETTQPNPYLTQAEERDITTTSEKKLTLVNPAYMNRQVYELEQEKNSTIGHLTSLKPINPLNTPDEWERKALEAIEQGESEYASIEIINNRKHMRFMRPLKTEERCLQCHAAQGYKVDDIRGGISVALPMEPYLTFVEKHEFSTFIGHVLLWFMGVIGIGVAYLHIKKLIMQ